jgi:two-component system LytT family response regulator
MIRAIVVDDESNSRKAVLNLLSMYCENIEVVGVADSCATGYEIINESKPELIFLDVELGDGTGFDLIKKFHKPDFKVIFVTAFDKYAIKAIKCSALDYILKPVNPNELVNAIEKAMTSLEIEEELSLKVNNYIENLSTSIKNKKIILNTSSNVYIVNITDIIRLQADQNYTHIHIDGKSPVMIAKTLKEFEEMLSEHGFFRIHQSHLINMSCIQEYEKGGQASVVLTNSDKVPVSSRKRDLFLKALSMQL